MNYVRIIEEGRERTMRMLVVYERRLRGGIKTTEKQNTWVPMVDTHYAAKNNLS